ncbi:MAG TPA: VgrG-related protein [Solirubrobacterales bacterium]|nr:VgrG-related protein [Solirubrobacterales bacterium]
MPEPTGTVAGVEVQVDGQPLDPEIGARLLEVQVRDNLALPDSFLIRVSDPGLESIDSTLLEIGAEVEIRLASADAEGLTSVLSGQVASLEPEFGADGAVIAARGYDHSHALNRSRVTETFQNMTADDIARKLATKAGLELGVIDPAGSPYDFIQQSNETDWEFLWRLASAIDFEVEVIDGKLHFRRAGGQNGGLQTLRWGDGLREFRPRVTGVQQVDQVVVRGWDEKAKQRIEASASAEPDASPGVERERVVSAMGGGTVTVADRPIGSQAEADALAKAIAARLGNAWVEATGVAEGDALLRAGTKVRIDGVGERFGGEYVLTSTTHSFRGTRGYETRFEISGRAARTLVELMTPKTKRPWGASVAVGIVTQNEDPDGLGRIRVKYPELGEETEGWWARIAAPGAGGGRGLMMTPLVGDEVLLAFEHGDVRKPYVLGALWNGKDQPGELVRSDGSFALRSDQAVAIDAGGAITIEGADGMEVEVKGSYTVDSQGTLTVKGARSVSIEAGTEIAIKAPSISIQAQGVLRLAGAQVSLG